jgi:hypothetical protein
MKTTLVSNGAMSYDLSKFDNRIIVAGTRKYNDYDSFSKTITDTVRFLNKASVIFISGKAASGADALIIQWCKENDYPWVEYPADWNNIDVPGTVIRTNKFNKKYNAIAGHMRNEAMADVGTQLIAFWDNVSSGTKNMIELAKARGLSILIHLIN